MLPELRQIAVAADGAVGGVVQRIHGKPEHVEARVQQGLGPRPVQQRSVAEQLRPAPGSSDGAHHLRNMRMSERFAHAAEKDRFHRFRQMGKRPLKRGFAHVARGLVNPALAKAHGAAQIAARRGFDIQTLQRIVILHGGLEG